MSQQATLRALDAEIMAAMKGVGIADAATYGSTPCDVYVDRNAEFLGDGPAQIAGVRTVITFQLGQVSPARGGVVTIGTESFELAELASQDESISAWVVQRV